VPPGGDAGLASAFRIRCWERRNRALEPTQRLAAGLPGVLGRPASRLSSGSAVLQAARRRTAPTFRPTLRNWLPAAIWVTP
jgi:hypothetical protein